MTRENLDGEVSGVAAMGFEWIQKPLGWRERYWKYVGASNASSVALDDLDDWISHGNPKSGGLVAGINRPPTGGDLTFSWKEGHICTVVLLEVSSLATAVS